MTDRCVRTDYPDGAYCVDCAEQPFIADIPAHVEQETVRAWDAGANLVEIIDGPCYLQWQPARYTTGAFFGFYSASIVRDVRNPANIVAAYYVFLVGTTMFARPYAGVVPLAPAFGVTESDTLRIEHIGTLARFLVGSTVKATATIFPGTTRCGASLYTSGDQIE